MTKYIHYYLLLIFFCFHFSWGQKQTFNWYFGNGAGLSFKTNPPTVLTDSKMKTFEGCACISDKDGNLLFYTDGLTIWDKNHDVMPNGTGLYGHPSATQSAVLVPMPNDPDIYYVFTVGLTNPRFAYTVVDMSLRGGLGDVDVKRKNKELFTKSGSGFGTRHACEKVAVVRHANGRDFWIVGHDFVNRRSLSKGPGNTFFVYLLTKLGLRIPKLYNVGNVHHNNRGYMRFSSSGRYLALTIGPGISFKVVGSKVVTSVSHSSFFQLFNFNNKTGEITERTTGLTMLTDTATGDEAYKGFYGIEFSLNEQYLYMSTRFTKGNIYQYEIKTGNRKVVATNNDANALQMASDGKIYVALSKRQTRTVGVGYDGEPYIGTIENTDTPTPIFDDKAIYLGGKFSYEGLPSFPTFFGIKAILIDKPCIGKELNMTLWSQHLTDYQWDFGDGIVIDGKIPLGGKVVVKHTYKKEGDYKIKVRAHKGLIAHVAVKDIKVVKVNPISQFDSKVFCEADKDEVMQAKPVGGVYTGTGVTGGTFSPQKAGVGKHQIHYVYTNPDGCISDKKIIYEVKATPKIKLDRTSDFYCKTGRKKQVKVIAKERYRYLWKDSRGTTVSTTEVMEFTQPDVYEVTASNGKGCTAKLSFKVTEPKSDTFNRKALTIVHNHASKGNYLKILQHKFKPRSDFYFALDDEKGVYQKTPEFTNLSTGSHSLYIKDQYDACNIFKIDFVVFEFEPYFSPNNDGINDVWRIRNWSPIYGATELKIYNRYGLLIRKIKSDESWDGKDQNGNAMLPDDYWFKLGVKSPSGEQHYYMGHFTLLD